MVLNFALKKGLTATSIRARKGKHQNRPRGFWAVFSHSIFIYIAMTGWFVDAFWYFCEDRKTESVRGSSIQKILNASFAILKEEVKPPPQPFPLNRRGGAQLI